MFTSKVQIHYIGNSGVTLARRESHHVPRQGDSVRLSTSFYHVKQVAWLEDGPTQAVAIKLIPDHLVKDGLDITV